MQNILVRTLTPRPSRPPARPVTGKTRRRTQQQGQPLFALTENTAINASAAAGGGGGVDRTDHGTFGAGGGREETKSGDVAAVPPRGGSSGGQPI